MMKRVFVVVEGQTEQEFVRSVLAPFFLKNGIYSISPILIRTSKTGRGGHVNADHMLNTVHGLLTQNGDDVVVSTFIDFFRVPTNMPEYDACMALANDHLRVVALEDALGRNVGDRRFLPYIQLHEFEALLFSSNRGFEEYFNKEQSDWTARIVSDFDNPEDINSSPETAPSKRIIALERRYDKVLQGNLIAMSVGIDDMLARCPRFAVWITSLVEMAKA